MLKRVLRTTDQRSADDLFYDKSVFRVIILASIIIIVSISLMGYLVYSIAHQQTLYKLKTNDLQFISQSIASKVDARIDRAKETSLTLSSDPHLIKWIKSREENDLIEADVLKKLKHLVSDYDYTKAFIVSALTHHYWTEQGEIIDTVSKEDSFDEWFFTALESGQKIDVNVDYNEQYEGTFVWINTLVREEGQSLGLVGVGLSLNKLSKELQSFTYGNTSNLWIMDEKGKIYLSNNEQDNGKMIDDFFPSQTKNKVYQRLENNNYKVIEYQAETGETVDLITHQLQSTDLKLVYQIPRTETMSFLQTVKVQTIIAIIISFISIIVIFYFISKRLANPYKRALEINMELDKKVEERTLDLKDRNEKITDSIQYAKRIQQSVLPSKDSLEEICQEHFIIYHPRDNVGGDFYWTSKLGEGYLLAVGDCTGHGVPGALMTMLSISVLNSISERNECERNPAAILDKLNTTIKETLNQKRKRGFTDDGLDIGLCYITPKKELIYAGAKLVLYKKNSEGIVEYKGERRSIGYRRTPIDFQYCNHYIDISGNETFYITTDGFLDQNGEGTEFGFGRKRFKQLIDTYHHLSLTEQKEKVENELYDYMKSESQRDDITVLAFTL